MKKYIESRMSKIKENEKIKELEEKEINNLKSLVHSDEVEIQKIISKVNSSSKIEDKE